MMKSCAILVCGIGIDRGGEKDPKISKCSAASQEEIIQPLIIRTHILLGRFKIGS